VIFHAPAGTPYRRRRGNVNRIKMIKRQMYGRAGFTLLRKRVLLAA
jgi:transposase